MKRFFISLLLIIALSFCLDRALGLGLAALYRHSQTTDEYKIASSVEYTTDSLLIMGSSRCLHNYDPRVFEKVLGESAFNTGDWGVKNIYFQYGLLCDILERYHPKAILLELHPSDYLDTPYSGIERVGSLAPYVGRSKDCDEIMKKADLYWKYRLSHVYRYSGSCATILAGNFSKKIDPDLKGLKVLDGQMNPAAAETEEYPFPEDPDRIHYLKAFADKCKAEGIQLAMIVSPTYVATDESVYRLPALIGEEKGFTFLDYSGDPDFVGHIEYFYDSGHMNGKGAEAYSAKVAEKLKELQF